MPNFAMPAWADKYSAGTISAAQGYAAYAEYNCVDGSGDENGAIEERVPVQRPLLRPYASRTGTKETLRRMRELGWSLLVSASGAHRTESFEHYALDNGAWHAYRNGTPFDEVAFGRAVDKVGENAQFTVLPDQVAGGLASLEMSLDWLENRLRGFPGRLLIAVQDGMDIEMVRPYLNPMVGIFVGGTTPWKLRTLNSWCQLARRRGCYVHVGRVNSLKRIEACAQAGAMSFDGTSVIAFPDSIFKLSRGVLQSQSQGGLFNPWEQPLHEVDYDCEWTL